MSSKINNKDLETIYYTVNIQFNMYIVNYEREKENITYIYIFFTSVVIFYPFVCLLFVFRPFNWCLKMSLTFPWCMRWPGFCNFPLEVSKPFFFIFCSSFPNLSLFNHRIIYFRDKKARVSTFQPEMKGKDMSWI